MILGLTGFKGSGKDTAGAYLIENHGFRRISFADKLKSSAAANWKGQVSPDDWDRWKNDPSVIVGIYMDDTPLAEVTAREFLQHYGTEAHRDEFGYDFWIDAALPVPDTYMIGKLLQKQNIVVTDVRFVNEAERVKEVGGAIIQIRRPDLSDANDVHASEVPLPEEFVNAVVYNTGTIEELGEAVWRTTRNIFPGGYLEDTSPSAALSKS